MRRAQTYSPVRHLHFLSIPKPRRGDAAVIRTTAAALSRFRTTNKYVVTIIAPIYEIYEGDFVNIKLMVFRKRLTGRPPDDVFLCAS